MESCRITKLNELKQKVPTSNVNLVDKFCTIEGNGKNYFNLL